jgi:hypothetical protein
LADLKRVDPPSRSVDGDVNAILANKDPNRWYIFANPNDEYCGAPAMEELGYVIEVATKGGVRIKGGMTSKEGSALMLRGQLLMSCPLELHLARYNEGQARADAIDAAIGRAGGIDGVRGATGRLAHTDTTKEVVNLS